MGYMVLVILSLVLAAVIAILSIRMLADLRWVLGFLRGTTGLLLLALAALISMAAADMQSYHAIAADQVTANVSFVKLDEQVYRATVVDASGNERQVEIHGDLWQPTIRLFDWHGPLKSAGLKPIFRFERIRGRYFSLEQERKALRDEPVLIESRFGIDLWHAGYHNNILLPGVSVSQRDTTFLPMADGALFQIHLQDQGLQSKPMNEPAQRAVSEWR